MDLFELEKIREERRNAGKLYLEFLRSASLSCGLYTLAAGAPDLQQPHSEDEVYFVISGAGQVQVGQAISAVKAGTIIFVPAHLEHRFLSITEELNLLVFFAPAEYTNRPPAP